MTDSQLPCSAESCDLQTLLEVRDFLQDISTGADVTDASRDSATEFVALLDAEYAEKWESCGAESNRHSGAVGAEKRAEQSNPGGGHEVTESDSKHENRDKPLPDEPTPAAGRLMPDVAQGAVNSDELLALAARFDGAIRFANQTDRTARESDFTFLAEECDVISAALRHAADARAAIAAQPPAAPVETVGTVGKRLSAAFESGNSFSPPEQKTIQSVIDEMIAVATQEDEGNWPDWTSDNRAIIDGWQIRLSEALASPAAPVETIDSVPSCGQENDYRRASPQRSSAESERQYSREELEGILASRWPSVFCEEGSARTPNQFAKNLVAFFGSHPRGVMPAQPLAGGVLESDPALFDILNSALGTMHYHRLMSALNWNGYVITREPQTAQEPSADSVERTKALIHRFEMESMALHHIQRDWLTKEIAAELDYRPHGAGVWQPIETAPKDGTPVDLFTVSGRRWCDYRFDKEQRYPSWTLSSTKDFDWQDRPIIPASSVTHWMPLPSSPLSRPELGGEK